MEIWTLNTWKKKSQPSERDLQKAAIKEWKGNGGFAQNIHPTLGSRLGIPDTEFLVGPFLIPIEFKVGVQTDVCIDVKDIRPAQRGWHLSYRDAGGQSGIIVGTDKGIFAPTIDQFCSGRQRFETQELTQFETASEAIQYIAGPLQFLLRQPRMATT